MDGLVCVAVFFFSLFNIVWSLVFLRVAMSLGVCVEHQFFYPLLFLLASLVCLCVRLMF